MAGPRPDIRHLSLKEYAIGVAFVVVAFFVVYLVVGWLNLPVPQFVVSGIAGALGVVVWFAFLNRRRG